MSFPSPRRRALIRSAGLGLLTTLAGCLSPADSLNDNVSSDTPETATTESASVTGSSKSDDTGSVPSNPTPSSNATSGTTHSEQPSAGESDSNLTIRLPGVETASSPGGLVSIAPPADVIVLNFFATWCPPCGPEMENIRPLRAEYSEEDVFIASITQERDTDAIKSFWDTHEGTWPVLMDPDARASYTYRVTTIPTILILDETGEEVHRHTDLVGKDRLRESIEDANDRSEDR